MFRRLFFGTVSRAIYSLVSILVTLPLVPFLIDRLGREAYGLVVLIAVFTAQGFGGLADLGFASAVTKYCAEYSAQRDRENLERLLGTSFSIYLLVAVGTTVVVWIVGYVSLDHVFNVPTSVVSLARTLLVILALGTGVDFIALWLAAAVDGFQRYQVGSSIQIGRVLLSGLLTVVLVHSGLGAIGWTSAVVLANLVAVIIFYLYLRRISGWSAHMASLDRDMLRTLWSFSMKVFVIRLTSVAYHAVDRIALGIYSSVRSLAAYDVCNKIHGVAVLSLGFTSLLTVPSVSSLQAAGQRADIREFFLRGTLYTVAMSLPIVIILMLLSPYVLAEWIGHGFEQYATEARVFLSYVLVWSLTPVGWNMMIGLNRTEKILPINIASVTLNVVISLSLASMLGLLGVILGTVIGNLVAVPLYTRLFLSELGIGLPEFLRRVILRAYPQGVLLALGLSALLHYYVPQSLVGLAVVAAAAGISYIVLFWFSGVDAVDRRRFLSLFRALRDPA